MSRERGFIYSKRRNRVTEVDAVELRLDERAVTCAFNLGMMEDLKVANDSNDLLRIIALHALKGSI